MIGWLNLTLFLFQLVHISLFCNVLYVLYQQAPEDAADFREIINIGTPGPGCSKLTTSLVNVSLKF